MLARQYGAATLAGFIESIPLHATVIDVGAGLSPLGRDTASVREDVTWINVDPCYHNESILAAASANAPTNVQFRALDSTNKDELRALQGTADRVYSYWLLPHLSLETEAPAFKATKNMLELLTPTGELRVGPIRNRGFGLFSHIRYKGSVQHSATGLSGGAVDDIVEKTKLWMFPRFVQRFSNRHGIHVGLHFVGGRQKN